jgi:hypothetical protein
MIMAEVAGIRLLVHPSSFNGSTRMDHFESMQGNPP